MYIINQVYMAVIEIIGHLVEKYPTEVNPWLVIYVWFYLIMNNSCGLVYPFIIYISLV